MQAYLEIYQGINKYDKLTITSEGIKTYRKISEPIKPTRRKYITQSDAIQLHYFVRKIKSDGKYRSSLLKSLSISPDVNTLHISLIDRIIDTIDYNWNGKISILVNERCELDHALSWLSTLGGAFSALGDYFANMAETAAKISMHQLQLAMRLNDPTIASRCKLYYSLSLIQRHRFRLAKHIIKDEFLNAINNPVRDDRLIRMCHGIWAKLQYELRLFKSDKMLLKYY